MRPESKVIRSFPHWYCDDVDRCRIRRELRERADRLDGEYNSRWHWDHYNAKLVPRRELVRRTTPM